MSFSFQSVNGLAVQTSAAQRMNLPGLAAATGSIEMPDIAARYADLRGAFAEFAKIQLQRAFVVQRAQNADPVANASRQNRKLGLCDGVAVRLQFGGRF